MRSWIIFLGLLFTTFTQAQVITGRVTGLNNHPIELAGRYYTTEREKPDAFPESVP